MNDKPYESNNLSSVKIEPIISAFITNLGKYNEGDLIGKWHGFPTTAEKIAQTLKKIGIDGVRYEEFFITDYETTIEGIYDCLWEYASLDELNYLACKLEDMTSREVEIYEAAIESGSYSGSVKDLINLTDNLDCFDYMEGIEDDYDLGYYWVEESGCYDTKSLGNLSNYIDYERFGRDIAIDESGTFTARGYIRYNGDAFCEEYDGITVPDEYKVFSVPKLEKTCVSKNKSHRSHDER